MQMLSLRITQIIATVSFTFAIPAAFAGQDYGTPHGTLTATTPDTNNLVYWPGESKPHHQIRADQTYTAASYQYYQDGKFDPHGSIGIRRFFQTRTPGTYSLGSVSEINVLTKDMPANSRFNQAQCNQDFGPYAPDQSTFTASSLAANDVYGVETIALVFVDGNNNETVLDYQKIDIYQSKANNAANFFVQNFRSQVALNTDTTKPYLGDPPRVTMNASPIYPGAKIWVVIYPGNSQATPPASATPISNTYWTAPKGDASSYPNHIYIDIGQYINGSGTYTLQAIQQSDTNVFGTESYGSPASFKINTNYKVTSQLGLVK